MKNKPAQTSIVIIFFLVSFMALTTVIFNKVGTFKRQESKSITQDQSVHVAEAGIDAALYQLNQTSGSFTGETESVANVGQYTTTIAASGPSNRTITSTGCVPSQASCNSKQVITIDATSSSSGQTYSYSFGGYRVLAGTGGISMFNSANILIGPTFSNGNITGGNNNSIGCPETYATGSISNQITVYCSKFPNYSPPFPLPDISGDYDDFYVAAQTGGNCPPVSGIVTIGPCKHTGNMSIPNNANVIVRGVVHVTGNLTINGAQNIFPHSDLGASGTIIIVNGTIEITGNSNIGTNTDNAELLFTSTSDLPNVILPTTYAISIHNNQPINLKAKYYTLLGGISVEQSSIIAASYAKSIKLANSAQIGVIPQTNTLTFVTEPGGGGGGGTWTLKKGTYRLR